MNSFTAPSSRPWTTLECQGFDLSLQELGLPAPLLMEQAARAISDLLLSLQEGVQSSTILFLCGPGNNGADGIAAARQLVGHPRIQPVVALPYGEGPEDSLLRLHLQAYRNLGGQMAPNTTERPPIDDSAHLLVVDALFGVGLTRAHSLTPLAPWQSWIQAAQGILAVDCPSGLDCTTGEVLGDALPATWTLSFVATKAGFALADGPSHCGEVFVAGIGVRQEIADAWLARGQRFPGQD